METQKLESNYGGATRWSVLYLVLSAILSAAFLLYRILMRLLGTQEGVSTVKFKNGAFIISPGEKIVPLSEAIILDDLFYNFLIPFALLCTFGLLLKWNWKKFFGFDIGLRIKDWLFLGIAILVMFLSGLLIEHEANENSTFMMRMIRDNGLLPLLLVPGFLLPVMEEILFRRFAFDIFAIKVFYPVIPIVLTSIGFTLLHSQYGGLAMYYILGLGIVLGYARYFSGGIILPILIHVANNFIPILMLK